MFSRKLPAFVMSLVFSLAFIQPTLAEEAAEPLNPFDAAMAAAVIGPSDIELGKQGTLKITQGEKFIPKAEANAMLEAVGNSANPNLLGIVMPVDSDVWWATVKFEPEGYISDEDAKGWNTDDMLKGLKEGTEAMNERRKKLGIPPLHVVGWVQRPNYDAASHRLIWLIEGRSEGETDSSVNYNTYALGREGYFSLNLITDLAQIEQYKPTAASLLGRLEYKSGKDYEAFNPDTDKTAAYGLAALVTGVAVKKLGLFAVMAATFAKFGKLILIGGGALLAGIAKLFKRNPS